MLDGVRIYNLKKNSDERGFFMELLRGDWQEFLQGDIIAQINYSQSKPTCVRAWHRHLRGQIDYICCLEGQLRVAIYNDQEGSASRGQIDEVILNSEQPSVVRVPGFYWHGTKAIGQERSSVLYMITKIYDYQNPDEQRRPLDDKLIINPKDNQPYDWNK